ncbi:DUF4988 domain-containing protein [Phocaeicola vulgatus ATCC 8482]|jgi:hypothetical protein|uniref:PL29 family lyase N-terminal domain-containing protein n=1 Tax=Phocaeicola vulgatus TaxID=821 RepID=UPI00234F98CB|nr:PL29 family lyase N-terminal domain-containing protein [Phocaeicola vulgatus]MDC7310542.1 DUF4988 domain-containing protein [Phocaeicola vulgatus ATCC 8482]
MNKKFLSAVLFGALMVTSTGTFVSCKDYDDDIDRIDNTLNDLKSQIAALQTEVANGDYVTNVTKTADGKGMTFTFSKGKSVTVALDVKDGADGKPGEPGKNAQQVTISDEGELMIDGVGTGIKAGKAEAGKPSIKIEGGNWWLINEKGVYEDTKIPASGLSAVQNDADKSWTLTLVDADGKQQVIEVPSAATMISEIVVAPNDVANSIENATAGVNVTSYTFAKPEKWDGPRALADNNSVIYAVSGLDIRVNPVGVNVAETPFTLVNTKNSTFPNIKFAATAESGDDALDFDKINGRAANTGNGLWSLGMKSFILSEADAKDFKEAVTKANNVAYAVTAGTTTRSLYNVAIVQGTPKSLNKVKVKEISDSEVSLVAEASIPTPKSITVDVNKTYTVNPVEAEAFYDMYFTVSNLDKDTYGVKWDNAARTFIVTKKPDMVTTTLSFPLTVTTLDNNGTSKVAEYTVNLSSSIIATPDYQPVTYNIPNLYDTDTNNEHFNISLETLKTALGDNYVTWGNNVGLKNTKYYIGEKADGTNKVQLSSTNHALTTTIVNGNGTATTDVNAAKNIKVTVNKTTKQNVLKLDKQYYLFVEFMTKDDKNPTFINRIVIPVTFTAPSVASQFTAKDGYVVDGNINAYFYNTANKNIELKRYFEAMDTQALLELKQDDAVAKKDDKTYTSYDLAVLKSGVLTLNGKNSTVQVPVDGTTNKELGYGKVLTVNASNKNYKDSYWAYSTNDKKTASFTIKVMSPIAEGTITPATGSSIKVIANSEKGFDITADMISAKDYTGVTTYNIMPDKTGDPTTNDVWESKQIAKVSVAKKGGDNNTYIKSVALTEYTAKQGNTPAKLGTINVKAEPLPNDTPSAIVVTVEDAWGYTTPKDVNVTIATK